MKRVLQLSFLVLAMLLIFDSSRPADAQRYSLDGGEYSGARSYRTYYRSSTRRSRRHVSSRYIKRARRRARRKKLRVARAGSARTSNYRRNSRRKKIRRSRKRTVASLNRKFKATSSKKSGSRKAAKGPVQIVISLPKQRVSIYKGGQVIASARVSTGRSGHRTPAGVFSIIQKRKRHFSNLYNSAPMPYMQRITWSGIALHAGNVSRAYQSHGCIRLPYGFAKKLFRRTSMGAHVIVATSPSSIKPITHEGLFQPMPQGAVLESNGVQTAANTPSAVTDTTSSNLALGGIPGFVKPVIKAANRLEEKKLLVEKTTAAGPAFEVTKAGALTYFEEKELALKEAKKLAFVQSKRLRKPRLRVQKVKRQRRPKIRALNKAEKRARWAHQIVEKRRDNPKFEGKWMSQALARALKRDETVASARARLDEVTERLDTATAQYDAVVDEIGQARKLVETRNGELREAGRLLKKANDELSASNHAIASAKNAVKAAINELKRAKAREKMPLRILVSPRLGRERIKDVQKLLTELGYEPGVADGAVGRNTRTAIKAFQREMDFTETGQITDKLVDDLYSRVGRTQKANAHMYVRQGFVDLFDVAVDISEPTKPIGTHVYTAMHFDKSATSTKWTAITVKNAGRKARKTRRSKKRRKSRTLRSARISAQEALGRVTIPGAVRRQVSMLLTPGSSMVLSDNGMSHETGKGTDFVVLTK